MKEIIFALVGSIITIVVTWLFNLITTKRQHKMEMQRLAVQYKLETSRKAISWLLEAKNDLYIVIWTLKNVSRLDLEFFQNTMKRADKLVALEYEARKDFNAIGLYYKFDSIEKKYELESMQPKMLLLQNQSIIINKKDSYNETEYQKVILEMISLFEQLHCAVIEMIEVIRKDNLNYLN